MLLPHHEVRSILGKLWSLYLLLPISLFTGWVGEGNFSPPPPAILLSVGSRSPFLGSGPGGSIEGWVLPYLVP